MRFIIDVYALNIGDTIKKVTRVLSNLFSETYATTTEHPLRGFFSSDEKVIMFYRWQFEKFKAHWLHFCLKLWRPGMALFLPLFPLLPALLLTSFSFQQQSPRMVKRRLMTICPRARIATVKFEYFSFKRILKYNSQNPYFKQIISYIDD